MKAEAENAAALDLAARYAAWATHTPQGQALHKAGILFKLPHKVDPHHLVPVETEVVEGVTMLKLPRAHRRARDGFALTDPGTDLTGALDHANYCIWCHNQGKDCCSKGLREKSGEFKKSAFGVPLAGCPLDEKISEMNLVEAGGHTIGALGIVVIDNPMCAATGHRICNDCMKACIYQKQEPVDIPQVETRVLKDVLALPWGFEIYALLTRWNPLNLRRPLPKPATGRKVLIVGLGPAGFTLAHHLMNDGHTVIGDRRAQDRAARCRDLAVSMPAARARRSVRSAMSPSCASRSTAASWRGSAASPNTASPCAGTRISSSSSVCCWNGAASSRCSAACASAARSRIDSAFALGFDHIALCAGAGRPTIVPMKNGLAAGVRQASDFLMALQLTGAAKTDSLANLQVRLPVVVIGGGLTAIDTATEALAYYPLQVEKFLQPLRDAGRGARRSRRPRRLDDAGSARSATEFLAHARAIRAERAQARARGPQAAARRAAARSGAAPTIAYRRRLIDSPSYTLNHEEVAKALEEGIGFAERLTPEEVLLDRFGCARALRLVLRRPRPTPIRARRRSRSCCPRARSWSRPAPSPTPCSGARSRSTSRIDGKYFQAFDENGQKVAPERTTKPSAAHVLMSVRPDGRSISFFGDLHPSFAGNVVKAMASAKQGYPVVSRMLERQPPSAVAPAALMTRLDDELRPIVHAINRLDAHHRRGRGARADGGARLRARAVLPAAELRDALAQRRRHAAGEGRASRSPAPSVDREHGLLSTIVLEMGGSSDLCAQLAPGEPVVLMGPTGHADRDAVRRNRAAHRRRARQRRAVLDRTGAARQRQPRDLFRRLQACDRPLQGRGDRARRRRHRVVLRRGAGLPPRPAAGQGLHRQHRRGARRLWIGRARRRPRSRSARSTAWSRSAPTA